MYPALFNRSFDLLTRGAAKMLFAGAGMAPKRAGNADGAVSPSLGMLAAYLPADVLP